VSDSYCLVLSFVTLVFEGWRELMSPTLKDDGPGVSDPILWFRCR